ncbi:hypothetical protein D3C76_1486180 [compost metagenome]
MSLYAKGKKVVVAPDYVSRQKEAFAAVCMDVQEIFILGVRVVKEDAHIWGGISSSPAKVTYFGGPQDKPEVSGWAAETGKEVEFVEGYFPSFLKCLTARK